MTLVLYHQLELLRKIRMQKLDLIDDNDADIHFGSTILRKGYPSPFNMETGYRIRPSKYGPADGVGQGTT